MMFWIPCFLADIDDRNAEATFGDETEGIEAANIHRDLSEWQERHATLALSKVKVLIHFLFDFNFGS